MKLKNIILGVAILFASVSFAQEHVVKVNPLGLAFGLANVGYEFSVNDSQSLTISGSYFNIANIKGFGAGLEYRFYFDGEAIQGWHAGPSVGFFSLKDNSSNSGTVISLGGEVGHQWVFGENFALDVFAGYSALIGGEKLLGLSGSSPTFGVSIGYAW